MHYLLHFLHSVLLTMTLRNSISSFFFNSSFLSYILYLIYTTLILSVLYSIYFIILGSIARFYGVKETFSSLLRRICLHPNMVRVIAPSLTSPMLSGLASSVSFLGRPEVPKEPVPPKMEESLWGRSGAPTGPDAPGLSRIGESASQVHAAEVEAEVSKLYEEGGVNPDQSLPGITLEDAAAIIISDDDEVDFSVDMPQGVSTLKVELAWKQKRPLEDKSPRSSPPKKRAIEEKEESLPPHEATLPRGVLEEDILPKRYEIFISDHEWVQDVRCSLLGLETETTPSRKDIDNSSCFIPRAASSESELPEVITDHWLPILRREGLLVECPPDQFTVQADWVPLYTLEGLQKYLPAALSSFPSEGTPSLTAVVPPEF